MTLLPPALSDYTSYSQTLPIRGKHSKRQSLNSISQVSSSLGEGAARPSENGRAGNRSPSPTKSLSNQSPPNTKTTPQAIMDQMMPPSPAALSGTDGDGGTQPVRVTRSNPGLSRFVDSNPPVFPGKQQQQQQAATIRFGGKTPGEIVTGSLRNRRPAGGGLKKAITMYQESRKQSLGSRKLSSEEGPTSNGFVAKGDLDSMKHFDRLSQEPEVLNRTSKSASESETIEPL